jgi:WS/DGAT/MGAT family acyltransferase
LHADTPEINGAKAVRTMTVERDPLVLEVAAHALVHATERVGKFSRIAATFARRALTSGLDVARRAVNERSLPDFGSREKSAKPPKTRFSERVSSNRVVDGFGMPISRIKRIRESIPGTTLNDVFLAVAGGGVRAYLQAKNELPEQSLRGLMPISLRSDASAGGNAVAGVPVAVGSDIADPIARLKAVHDSAHKSKSNAEAVGLDMLMNVLDVLPPTAVNFALDKFLMPTINMAVSNVRGPDKAIYLAGAKAMCVYPVSIPADTVGLNITGVSYNRVMWVSAVSCRNMVPDPGFFLECLRGAWLELLAAADALKAPVTQTASPKVVAKTTSRKPDLKIKTSRTTLKPAAKSVTHRASRVAL